MRYGQITKSVNGSDGHGAGRDEIWKISRPARPVEVFVSRSLSSRGSPGMSRAREHISTNYYIERSFRRENLPGFLASDDPCCHVSRILEQSHVTSASERNCGATANNIMVEQSHGTSASERYCGATIEQSVAFTVAFTVAQRGKNSE
jgi:hypothetical protein